VSRQLCGADTEQLDQVGGATPRIGDRLATAEPERGLEAAVDLGDQHRPRGDRARLQLGQRPQGAGVGIV
jgi:hypothetical protein